MSTVNDVQSKVRSVFPDAVIYKNPEYHNFFSSKSIPSFLRDWIIMRFADEEGNIDIDKVANFIKSSLPGAKDWESLKSKMVNDGQQVRFLGKIRIEVDVKMGKTLFQLPEFGYPKKKYEALVDDYVMAEHKEDLLSDSETWGLLTCEYRPYGIDDRSGAIWLVDFKPFRPYKVSLSYYQEARREFTLDEWIDVLLMAIDYNPAAFPTQKHKLTLLSRLLPFLEKRVNLIELAPKGTGKSYMMSQLSKYGWLISGGSISRAKLFYDMSRRVPGLVSHYDFVVFDEIQTIEFPDPDEMAGALKGYLEMGQTQIGAERIVGSAGIVLMGNIESQRMDVFKDMFQHLPSIFQESALLDRFHGFIRGWDIPRMKSHVSAHGWSLNVEYFTEILHAMREDLVYAGIVDDLLNVPSGSDLRDTTAIKRLTTGFMKLLFPNVREVGDVNKEEFQQYCLEPAKAMRTIIKMQMSLRDREFQPVVPDITVKS